MIVIDAPLEDGTVWRAGSGCCYPRDIIINADDVSEMTDAELVANVRGMIWHARKAQAIAIAGEVMVHPTIYRESLEGLMSNRDAGADNALAILQEFAGEDGRIDDVLASIAEQEFKRGLKRAPHKSLRRRIIERDLSLCRYCGANCHSNEHIDHVIPYSCGGLTESGNLVCACGPCNMKKGARTLKEAGMELLEVPDAIV